MQAADRGFTAAFLTTFPNAIDHGSERARAERDFAELTRRAKDAGRLRADFDLADLILLLMANNGIAVESAETTTAASRRLVAYLLQSFQADHADPANPLPPPPPLELHHLHGSPTTRAVI